MEGVRLYFYLFLRLLFSKYACSGWSFVIVCLFACLFLIPYSGSLFRENKKGKERVLDLHLNFSKAWRCLNRNQLQTWRPLRSPTEDANPALLPGGFPLCCAHTASVVIAQIQSSLMWKEVLLVDVKLGFVHLSAAAKWLCSQSVWSCEDTLSICCPQLWPSSLPSVSSLWNVNFFFSCSGYTRVSTVLQKSLPVALQHLAVQTPAADSEKCMAFGY